MTTLDNLELEKPAENNQTGKLFGFSYLTIGLAGLALFFIIKKFR